MYHRLPFMFSPDEYEEQEEVRPEEVQRRLESVLEFLDIRFFEPMRQREAQAAQAASEEPMVVATDAEGPGTSQTASSQPSVSDVAVTLATQLAISTVTSSGSSQSALAAPSSSSQSGAMAGRSEQLCGPSVIATDIDDSELQPRGKVAGVFIISDPQASGSTQQGKTSPKRKADGSEAPSDLSIFEGRPGPKEARKEGQGSGGGDDPDPNPSPQAVPMEEESGDSQGQSQGQVAAKSPTQSQGQAPVPGQPQGQVPAPGQPQGQAPAPEPFLYDAQQAAELDAYEASLERARVEKVGELIKRFNTNRTRPLSPDRERLFHQLPRNVVQGMWDELLRQEMYQHMGQRRRLRRSSARADSDIDSDEEIVRLDGLYPDPQDQARFVLSDIQRLLRLLILGGIAQAPGTRDDPIRNRDFHVVNRMIEEGSGTQVVEILKDVSVKGRSAKQDYLIYTLAKCCRCEDLDTKRAAYDAVQVVCRIPTHLFQLVKYIEGMVSDTTGWGRGMRRAVCKWYNSAAENPMRLAMHVTKYQQREGWSHRDVIRLSHIKPVNETVGFIVRFVVRGLKEAEKAFLEDGYLGREQLEKVHQYLKAVEEVKKNTTNVERTLQLIQQFGLVREQLRTELLNEPEIWTTMLRDMPLTALTRNLGKMSKLNLFENPQNTELVVSKLGNTEAMKKARVHPLKLLIAHHTYRKGTGDKGGLTWNPNPEIVAALERAFYSSFDHVQPSGKKIMIALDISSSMMTPLVNTSIEVREAATLMAMVTYRTETNCDIMGFHNKLIPLEMFKDRSKTLEQLMQETHRLGFGTTDCSKPMIWARKHRKEYDAFVMYTDSETNSHRVSPHAALKKYRRTMNIPTAKLVVVGMTASNISIASPDDMHMLDVVGFDPDTPEMIREFLVGGLE